MRTRLSSKGQIVLPKELRDRRGLRAGAELEIEEVPEGMLLRLVGGRSAGALGELLERNELGWHAYALNLRGGLLYLAEHIVAAEADFNEAMAVARAQGALSYELRAANGLAQLWQAQGRRSQVRALIEPLLGQFAAGFSTPDLDEARALLSSAGR